MILPEICLACGYLVDRHCRKCESCNHSTRGWTYDDTLFCGYTCHTCNIPIPISFTVADLDEIWKIEAQYVR